MRGSVLAPGAWIAPLGRLLGIRLPVQAGKGYSFEVRPRRMPRHALLLLEPHVGCSPLGPDRLRIAGTMEFSGISARLNRRRIESIIAGAREMIAGWASSTPTPSGAGCGRSRPTACRSSTAIHGVGNVFFAGAYSMLGMTLAAPAAESLATFVMTGTRPPGSSRSRVTGSG